YIGLKIIGKGCTLVDCDTGLDKIEAMATADEDAPAADTPGTTTERDILDDYLSHIHAHSDEVHGLKIVVDAGNGMAGWLLPHLLEDIDVEVTPLYFELDGAFPNHDANPLKEENTADLRAKVVEMGADLGVAFDGDGDRVAFVDEKGVTIACDLMTALIAQDMLAHEPGAAILYDLRASWAVKEHIEACGGRPVMTRVGHSRVKIRMREEDALFGGELSGHYYFRANHYCDSGALALMKTLALLTREGKPVSELMAPLRKYVASGEINSEVGDKDAVLAELERLYSCGRVMKLDGLSVEFEDWWFNVRSSNTEPVLRLVVEAKTRERMETMRDQLLACIRRPMSLTKILFPTDFSPFSLQALDYAAALAQDYGAELHVLHVVPTAEMILPVEPAAPIVDTSFFDEMEAGAEERLQTVVPEALARGLDVTLAMRRGSAFVEIVQYAREEGISLVVIATHGRTGLRHALFGSVAEKVVRKAPCPVLSIRPKGHEFHMP
ncbi:universal stress protein, partial [bacterium]|nr:universal stress protein [bacterium]